MLPFLRKTTVTCAAHELRDRCKLRRDGFADELADLNRPAAAPSDRWHSLRYSVSSAPFSSINNRWTFSSVCLLTGMQLKFNV